MKTVQITGGNGFLGRTLVPLFVKNGYQVRISSRGAPKESLPGVEWSHADLSTGEGLAEAVAGSDVIVHAASNVQNTQAIDVDGTRRLLEHARQAKVDHIVYVSIVGIDRIPFGYYQHKLAAENLIKAGGVPWSILRATQFHPFLDLLIQTAFRLPVVPLPTDFQFQVIDPSEVAQRLMQSVADGPAGQLPDIGGPEILRLGDMVKTWKAIQQRRRPVVPLWLPGQVANGFRQGYNTTPAGRYGRITWAEWLQTHYGQSNPLSNQTPNSQVSLS